jgi:hypothetical protein
VAPVAFCRPTDPSQRRSHTGAVPLSAWIVSVLVMLASHLCMSGIAAADSASQPAMGVSGERVRLRGLGMVVKLGRSSKLDDQQIELLGELGVSTVVWSPGEWADNEKAFGRYALSPEVARVIHELATAQIHLVVVLFRKNNLYSNPLDPAAFARYSAWIVNALKDEPVAAYQIWNEPSNFDFRAYYGGPWNGVDDAPWRNQFVTLMSDAARAIKEVDPRATVSVNLEGPALVYALRDHPHDFSNINGVSIHPYSGHFPPEQVPWGGTKNYVRDGVAVADSSGSLVSNLRNQAYDFPQQYLGHSLQPWITEYGFPTCDLTARPQNFNCVSSLEQAAFEARGLLLGFSQGARLWSVYELADEGTDRSDPEQHFGVTLPASMGYLPKPAFYTLQRIARVLGSSWNYLPNPPALLVAPKISVVARQDSPASRPDTISGPQMAWFSTARGYAGFIWVAGLYSDDSTDSRLTVHAPLEAPAWHVEAFDLVTGQKIVPSITKRPGALEIDHLPLSSRPVVTELLRP